MLIKCCLEVYALLLFCYLEMNETCVVIWWMFEPMQPICFPPLLLLLLFFLLMLANFGRILIRSSMNSWFHAVFDYMDTFPSIWSSYLFPSICNLEKKITKRNKLVKSISVSNGCETGRKQTPIRNPNSKEQLFLLINFAAKPFIYLYIKWNRFSPFFVPLSIPPSYVMYIFALNLFCFLLLSFRLSME